jgi:hypothetical protein
MKRLLQILLIVTFIGFSWLAMQAVHEAGHVLVARLTGGEVIKVALHPLIVSSACGIGKGRTLALGKPKGTSAHERP